MVSMADVLQAKFVGELPDSNEQWQVAVFNDIVIFVNNDHEPRAVVDGKLVVIKAGRGEQGELV